MRKIKTTCAIIISVGLVASTVVVVWQSPTQGQTLIDVLRILLSWPVVVGVIAFAFGIVFCNELSDFLKRVGTIRLPGGTEISSSPSQARTDTKDTEAKEEKAITLTTEQQEIINQHIKGLQEKIAGNELEREELFKTASNLLEEKQREVIFWWFEFLSLFLVPTTQLVLKWFSTQATAPTKTFYDEFWKPIITDTKQREIILMVLLHHGLVTQDGVTLKISDAGRQFLVYVDAKRTE